VRKRTSDFIQRLAVRAVESLDLPLDPDLPLRDAALVWKELEEPYVGCVCIEAAWLPPVGGRAKGVNRGVGISTFIAP
jgi:hypothetical protein